MNRAILYLAIGASLGTQAKPDVACRLVNLEEARSLLGAAAVLDMATPAGQAHLCVYSADRYRMQASLGPAPAPDYLGARLEKLKQEHNGKDEPGLGDRAISYVDGGTTNVLAVRGARLYSLQTIGPRNSIVRLRALMARMLARM